MQKIKVKKYILKIFNFIESILVWVVTILILLPISKLSLKTAVKIKMQQKFKGRAAYDKKDVYMSFDTPKDFKRARGAIKEPGTIEWIENNIKKGEVVYDVGANVGLFSLIASKFNSDQVEIYSFEPSYSTFNQLVKNILMNNCGKNVFPFLFALSSETAATDWHYSSVDAGTSFHGLGSSINCKGVFRPEYTQKVICYKVDDLVERFGFKIPNHIKIDVDANEYDILLGAEKTLSDVRFKTVIVEYQKGNEKAGKIDGYMRSLNFEVQNKYAHKNANVNDAKILDIVYVKKQ